MSKRGNKFKKGWNKFLDIVWRDESPKGWIISIIFLFVLIKFIFFPLLNLATGTSLPLAIVESCSMHHKGNIFSNFDSWYGRHEQKYSQLTINKLDFKEFSMKNGFSKGDVIFIVGVKPEKIEVGDVIIFAAGTQNPIIHRIISIQEDSQGKRIFSTYGDNNNGQLSFEKNISESQIMGKAVFRIAPSVGWIKLVFFESLKPPYERGFCEEN